MLTVFVTVGTQLSFDRLLHCVDQWAQNNTEVEIIVQSCNSDVIFNNIKVKNIFSPQEYKEIVSRSDVLVGHAGMGTIIAAHEQQIPLIIMPRLYSLGEHRNNHQLSTSEKFKNVEGVYLAENRADFIRLMDDVKSLSSCKSLPSAERLKLIDYVKNTFLA